MRQELKEAVLTWVTFLTSTTTLLCCTIPIILIGLGFGAALASFIPHAPWWENVSKYKFLIFAVSGSLLLLNYAVLRISAQSCPADPALAEKCQTMRKWNWRVLILSVVIWVIGFISAYLLPSI